jgi:hypothetical protein
MFFLRRPEKISKKSDKILPKEIHHAFQLIILIASWKQRKAKEQFSSKTSQRPDINGSTVRKTKQNFRSSIESRLNIGVHCSAFKTG